MLIVLVALAWARTLPAPFLLDDHGSVLGNHSITHLWPPDWILPPATGGETVSGRPVLNLTFAIDYAIDGTQVRVYRVTNLLIHIASGLTLLGILRRTPWRIQADTRVWFALFASLAWAVHPLQTAAVTYIAQRAEALAALFLLLSLYSVIRAAEPGPRRGLWTIGAVTACLLGMATKETMAVAPLIILLYDRAFLSHAFAAAWRERRGTYVALAATWLPLAALTLAHPGRGGSAGWGSAIDPWSYALTQCAAIVRYLGLAFWPAGLVFDYGTPVVTQPLDVAPQALALAGLLGITLWALARNRPAGFLGAAFFLLLAPSSSIVPVATQTMAEHRMYLALAPLLVAVGGALVLATRRGAPPALPGLIAVVAIVALTATTRARNEVYRSEERLWRDTTQKAPDNPRAHYNLGLALARSGQSEQADAEFRRTLDLQPNHAFALFELGKAALQSARWAEAISRLEQAVRADPGFVDARVNLAQALVHAGRSEDAIAQYRHALTDEPRAPDIRANLAAVLLQHGDVAEAGRLLRDALAAAPDMPEAHYQLGLVLTRTGEAGPAEAEFRTAVRLRPSFAEAQRAVAVALANRGDLAGAETAAREALRVDDHAAESWYVLGNALAGQRRIPEAMDAFRSALRLNPTHVPALNNLGNCQLVSERFAEAIATYEAVLRLTPEDTAVRENLRLARELERARPSRP